MAKANIFNSVKQYRPTKNAFDLSHDVKLSCDMGQLVPILALDCLPGDKFSLSCESLLRFQPLITPVMHRMDVTMHYFFVPNRLLWKNWENFITNTPVNGNIPAFPYIKIANGNYTELHDYIGIPKPTGLVEQQVSALPFAAYQLIFNEYYRDQNLIPEIPGTDLADGWNSVYQNQLSGLRRRAWEHDYFTAALPFAQKGPAVDIPLGDVTLKENWANPQLPKFRSLDNDVLAAGVLQGDTFSGSASISSQIVNPDSNPLVYDPAGSLEVTATTINDLRKAFKLQEWLEKNARGGTRYTENIFAHFGVKSSDARLQRPEYITGTKSPVVISEVLNTTGTDDAPQGNMAGHGVSVTSGQYGKFFCEEHGYIIGIMSIMPKTAYQQGIDKHFQKFDQLDFGWPDFAHLGEQAVLNREVYADGPEPLDTFGYVPRFAEYKFVQNRVAGDMRTTLSDWHLGRIFSSQPHLNEEFVTCTPSNRIFAVQDPGYDRLICHVFNKIKAFRSLPKFGTPSF